MSSLLPRAILTAIAYHDIFDFALDFSNLKNWLYQYRLKNPDDGRQLKTALDHLKKQKKITLFNGHYCLYRRSAIIFKTIRRKKTADRKMAVAGRYARLFSFLPWVKLVGVTGNLAMQNADELDDIDLIIITKTDRLWLIRMIIVGWLKLLRARPVLDIKKSVSGQGNKICTNLWLDSSALKINTQNVFTAHELLAIKPLVDKNNIYNHFLAQNKWVYHYWPNQLPGPGLKQTAFITNKPVNHTWLSKLNKRSYNWQFKFLKKLKLFGRVNLHQAFLHRQQRSQGVIRLFKKRLDKI